MSYRVEITRLARLDVRGLSGYLRAQALSLISALAHEPRPPRAKELCEQPRIYRIWLASRWRVAYEVEDGARRLIILRVRDRDHLAYDSLTWAEEASSGYDADVSSPADAKPE